MRRIWTSTDRDVVDLLGQELNKHDIPHTVDTEKVLDWGSEFYGSVFFSIWSHNDADVERAKALLSQLVGDQNQVSVPVPNLSTHSPLQQFLQQKLHQSFDEKPVKMNRSRFWTILIVFLCILFFIFTHRGDNAGASTTFPTQNTSSTACQHLLFDYPNAFLIEDEFVAKYGIQNLNLSLKLDAEGTAFRNRLLSTSYWGGLYTSIVDRMTGRSEIPPPSLSPSLLCERIREGQVWRVISPCFVHGDIFHLAFNMLWLMALGSQIERKIGFFRYLILILIIGVVSNTAQYLMTGPYFLGFSGVICGMASFIIEREQQAPWEGYGFSRRVYSSLLFFIWALVALAVVAFLVECYVHLRFPISFANTAHLSGLAIGVALGKTRWFSEKQRSDHSLLSDLHSEKLSS